MNNKRCFFLVVVIFVGGMGMFSCSTKSGTQTQHKVNLPDNPHLAEIQQLLKGKTENHYQSSDQGIIELEEESNLKIEPLTDTRFRHFEVYNIYERDEAYREYYVSEFTIDTEDSVSRQKIEDYQLILARDSVYKSEVNRYEFIVAGSEQIEISNHNYKMCLLVGFGHEGAELPDQFSIWSPQCGIIASWYGEERWFALSESDYMEDGELMNLLAKGRTMIEEHSHEMGDHDH
ncbi:MAG: hypothetical protein R3B93_17575 [Bacteroidia bacterium]